MAFRKAIKQVWGAIWERTWASVLFCGLTALGALLAIGSLGIRFFPGFLKDYNQYFPGIAAGVSAIVVAFLVGATIVYARAAKQQADASVTMAEEMREQRLGEARPYLLLRLKDRVVQWKSIEPDKHRPTEFQITIHNAGKGPAINLCTALWHPYKSRFVCERKGYLVAGEKWQTTISRFTTLIEEKKGWLPKLGDIVEQNKTGIIAVECEDIHKRTWVSYLYLEKHAQDSAFVVAGEHNIMELKK